MDWRTEQAIWNLQTQIMGMLDCGLDKATQVSAPLTWWVSTGRCSGTQEIALRSICKDGRSCKSLATRLINGGTGDYEKTLDGVRELIDRRIGK